MKPAALVMGGGLFRALGARLFVAPGRPEFDDGGSLGSHLAQPIGGGRV